jgi:YVTN family beta-propeller protein
VEYLRTFYGQTMFWLLCSLFSMPILMSAPFVYVANFSNHPSNQYFVINAATNIVSSPYTLPGNEILGAATSPDGKKAYFTSQVNGELYIIDTSTQTLLHTVSGLTNARGIAITPDGNTAYVASSLAVIYKVNLLTLSVESLVTDGESASLTITPNGQYVYVCIKNTNLIDVIKISDNSRTSIDMGNMPLAIAFTPNGTKAVVTLYFAASVSILDVASQTIDITLSTASVGSFPWGVAISPDGKRAYVSCFENNAIAIINMETQSLESEGITVGQGPYGIAVTPDGAKAFVTCSVENAVSVITLADNSVTTLSGFNSPYAITITPSLPSPSHPRKCTGKIKKDRLLSLTWKKNKTPHIVRYDVFAHKKIIASIPATAKQVFVKKLHSPYLIHKRLPKKYLRFLHKKYYIKAITDYDLSSKRAHPKISQ